MTTAISEYDITIPFLLPKIPTKIMEHNAMAIYCSSIVPPCTILGKKSLNIYEAITSAAIILIKEMPKTLLFFIIKIPPKMDVFNLKV